MVNVLTHCRPVDRRKYFLLRPNNTLKRTLFVSFGNILPMAQLLLGIYSHKWPFNRLFRTLTPRLLLPPLSLFLLYTCVRLGPLIRGELFLGFPTGTLVCVYSSVRMPLFHKFDMPFCCHGKPSLKIYISAFGLDVFLSQWFRACCPQGQI